MAAILRFGDLVGASGRPEVWTLWSNPKSDRAFMQAVKKNRVLTVFQEPTSQRKDFGRIGFHQRQHASYFIFPDPLPKDDGSRVIGINYNLVESPEPSGPLAQLDSEAPRHRRAKSSKRPAKKAPVAKQYSFRVRRVATVEDEVRITARNRNVAKEEAIERVKHEAFDLGKARIREEIVGVA